MREKGWLSGLMYGNGVNEVWLCTWEAQRLEVGTLMGNSNLWLWLQSSFRVAELQHSNREKSEVFDASLTPHGSISSSCFIDVWVTGKRSNFSSLLITLVCNGACFDGDVCFKQSQREVFFQWHKCHEIAWVERRRWQIVCHFYCSLGGVFSLQLLSNESSINH